MNIWDESPPPARGGESNATPPDESGVAGDGGSGAGGDEPPSDPAGEPEERWWSQRIAGIPAWMLLAFGIVIWIAVIAALVLPGSDDPEVAVQPTVAATLSDGNAAPTPPTPPTPPTSPTTTTDPAAALSSTPASPAPPPTEPTTTTTAPPATTTTAPPATTTTTTNTTTTTTVPTTPTTAPPVTTTTVAPTTTTTTTTAPAADTTTTTVPEPAGEPAALEATTVVGDAGQSITVTPRRGRCSSGPDCLVVGFTIDGWATQPTSWVCEFSSGARYVFRFSSGGADPACSTVDVPDSIVVEIEGLRSDPITIG